MIIIQSGGKDMPSSRRLRRMSPRVVDTLIAIDDLIAERDGVRPTLREIAARLGLASVGSPPLVKRWVDQLVECGLLTYVAHQARTMSITEAGRAAIDRQRRRGKRATARTAVRS